VPKAGGPGRQPDVPRKLALKFVDVDRRIEKKLKDRTGFYDERKLGSLVILETRPALGWLESRTVRRASELELKVELWVDGSTLEQEPLGVAVGHREVRQSRFEELRVGSDSRFQLRLFD
jgi:hypothetical protein